MRIRRARRADAAAVSLVYVRSWRAAFAGLIPQDYLDAMDPRYEEPGWAILFSEADWPAAGALVVETGEGVVAFAGFGPAGERAVAEVGTFYALPGVWGTGAGRHLMASLLEILEEAGYVQGMLWVLEANERARRFYETAGWRADGATEDDTTGGVRLAKVRYRRDLGR